MLMAARDRTIRGHKLGERPYTQYLSGTGAPIDSAWPFRLFRPPGERAGTQNPAAVLSLGAMGPRGDRREEPLQLRGAKAR